MRPDYALFLSLREHIHPAAVTRRPITFSDAMHKADIDVIGSQLTPEAVQIFSHAFCISRIRLGHHYDLVPRNMLERRRHTRVASVAVRRIKETQAVFVAIH